MYLHGVLIHVNQRSHVLDGIMAVQIPNVKFGDDIRISCTLSTSVPIGRPLMARSHHQQHVESNVAFNRLMHKVAKMVTPNNGVRRHTGLTHGFNFDVQA